MFQIGSYTLTPDDVAARKRYLEIGDEDERLLREAHARLLPHASSIIERFYRYLFEHAHTREMLSAPGLVARLKELQERYFRDLTSGRYDVDYFENRLRVGQAHHRIGLSPEWYLGAYLKYLHIVGDVLGHAFGADFDGFYRTMLSLTKIIYLDMGLSIDAYHFSAQGQLESKNRELCHSNDELHRIQDARRQLSDMIVHDLQNPLAGVTAFLQTLQSRAGGLAPGDRTALEEALRRCEDLSQMILNVLHVSRAEAGKLQTYIESVDLSRVIREVEVTSRLIAEGKGQLFETEAPAELKVRTDEMLVRRMVMNLIRNALRHTPCGSRIRVRLEAVEGGRGRIRVSDDGPGIPSDAHPVLFEPFGAPELQRLGVRVDTGLGLAFCRVASQALGVALSVESDGQSGTTFTLDFP